VIVASGEEVRTPETDASKSEEPAKPQRLTSLDAFRGVTIVLMLLVNNVALGDLTPATLLHAGWNSGVNVADLVFPWFLLCVGLSAPLSLRSSLRRGENGWFRLRKALSRTVVLFLIGCLIDSSIKREPYIGFGVLQLIAVAYLIGSQLAALSAKWRWGAVALLLVPYGLLIRYAAVPGHGSSAMLEDLHFVKAINDLYLEPLGLRGLLSVIPTAGMVLIGACLGSIAVDKRWTVWRRSGLILAFGVTLTLIGWLWSLSLPMNKAIWTPSYIVYTAGLGAVALAACMALFDALPLQIVAFPLAVFGSNALAAYIVPIMVKVWVLQVWTVPGSGGKATIADAWLQSMVNAFGQVNGGWLYVSSYIAAAWVVLAFMKLKGWYLKA
jgi:predicted acyltransferase